MQDLPHSKPELRQLMRAKRRALSAEQQRNAALAIAGNLSGLNAWSLAQRVALYLAADGEADPSPIADALRASGKTPFLPVIQGDKSLRFAPWHADATLIENRYGIPEPQSGQQLASEMDIVLMPLVAWSPRGDRLGMGGGFYDRSLAGAEVLKVGLAYEVQRTAHLDSEDWDIRMDYVATELALYNCLEQ